MPPLTRRAPRFPRLTALCALMVAAPWLCAEAGAATTIGSDLSAAPDSACTSVTGCTATNLETGGPHPVAAPMNGVVVRFRVKHGATLPGAAYTLKILSSGGTGFTLERQLGPIAFDRSAPGGIDVVGTADDAGRPRGTPISSGQRIGVYAPGGVGFQGAAAGAAVAEHDGDHASGTAAYGIHSGYEALINADIEPDRDGDGYGDESQDNCPAFANDQTSNPCPPGPPAGGGAALGPALATGVPPGYVKPRIGRLARPRRPLSSLARKGLGVTIACHGPCSARGSLVIRTAAGRSVTVGRGRRRSASRGTFRLRLKLTGKGRRLLRRSRRDVRASLRVSASDAWGRSARRQRLVVTRR